MNLALPLSSSERLGKLFNRFESRFTYLASESNNIYFTGYREDDIRHKKLSEVPRLNVSKC